MSFVKRRSVSDGALTVRDAESLLFGRRIASVNVSDSDDLPRLLARARAASVELLVARVASELTGRIRELEAAGAALCDKLITFSQPIPPQPGAVAEDVAVIRLAVPADAAALHGLGRRAFSEFGGHWHTDRRLPNALCTQLYAQWAASLASTANASQMTVLALTPVGDIAGFLALAEREAGVWEVPLAAVEPSARGRNLLSSMARHALRLLAVTQSGILLYETQVTNHAAIRSVVRIGFMPATSRYTFHIWLDAT